MELDDANTLCRTCLQLLTDDVLDTSKHDIFLTPDIVKKLVLCTSLTVEPEDGYPKHLCDCCFAKVNEFHEFQTMCVESAQHFKELHQYREAEVEFGDEKPFCYFETTKMEVTVNETNALLQSGDDPMRLQEVNDPEAHKTGKGSKKEKSSKSKTNAHALEKEFEPDVKFKKRGCKKKQAEEKSVGNVKKHDDCNEDKARHESDSDLDENLQSKVKKARRTTSKATSDNTTTRHYCTEPGCDRSYTQKQSVNLHLRLHHKIGPEIPSHICEICGKSFKFLRNLNDHRFTHRDKSELPYPCELAPDCLRRFAKKDKLKDHMMRHTGIKNYVCPICGLRKVTGNELKSHMNYHTLERTWPCHLCAYVSKNAGNLKVHMRTIHGITDNGEKPYACAECGKSFNHPAALGSHEKIHRRQLSKA